MGVAESILKAALFVLVASTGEKFAARRTGRGATSTRLSSVALKLMLKRNERRKISTGNRQLAGGNNGGSGSREGTARDLIAAISASKILCTSSVSCSHVQQFLTFPARCFCINVFIAHLFPGNMCRINLPERSLGLSIPPPSSVHAHPFFLLCFICDPQRRRLSRRHPGMYGRSYFCP